MSPCDEYRVKILRYLDNDLRGHELDDFRSHLETCADCRANVEAACIVAPVASITALIFGPGYASLPRVGGCYTALRITCPDRVPTGRVAKTAKGSGRSYPTRFKRSSGGACCSPSGFPFRICTERRTPSARRELRGNGGGRAS
jgi:hypothetical protein